MGKGPETESKSEQPKWYQEAAKAGLQLGNKVAQTGYVPYTGPDVAAFNPQQVAGMQSANDWAAAFGGPGAKSANVAQQIMPAQDFGGGLKGYSSVKGYNDALRGLRKGMPGLFNYLKGFQIDPKTGAPAKNYASLKQQFTPVFNNNPMTNSDNVPWNVIYPGRDSGGKK